MVNGSCLIPGSILISGELSGSRLIRFELGGAACAVLHTAQRYFHLPWGQGLETMQSLVSLP